MAQLLSLRRLIIIVGVFALLFSIFLALHNTPTVLSDDPAGTVIESNDPLVSQQGTWTLQAANGASGGSYLYSSGDESDALLLPFEGTRIEILYVKNPSLGDFAIEIDNTIRRTVVTTDDETSFGNSAVVDYLENGPHVLKIFATDGVIAIDAFIGTPFIVNRGEASESNPYGDLGPQRVGEIEQSNQDFSYRAENDSFIQTIHELNATYIKIHFAEMNLADGETVTVSNPDGSQVHTYPGSGYTTDADPGFWAFSIIGDTAIVEIHGRSLNPDIASGNVTIDKYARGYSEAELLANSGLEESTCGATNERIDVACYSGSHPTEFGHSNAVAKIIISGVGSCTAWRISPGNYMLTNEHCITNQTHVNATEVWFNYQRDTCGGSLGTTTIVDGASFLTDNYNLDFALFTVNDFGTISSFGHLDPDVRTAILGEEIYIPQHGAGNPKEFGIESDLNSGNVCRVDDAVLTGRAADTDTGYYCDTTGGSSGSPVLARSSHRVVALHHFGIIGSTCSSTNMNSGTRIDLIYPYITNYFNLYKPTTPTLTAPTGTISDTTPTYSWDAQANAEWYQLYVNGPSGNVISEWYDASTAGCGAGTGTCSVTPTTALALGAHQWWIRAWTAYASAWSAQGDFTVFINAPAEINRISPTGNISTNPPTFSWTADQYATWYRLYVKGPDGTTVIIDEWYSDADAGCPSGTGTCSVTPSVIQQGGAHQWWMQPWGPGGYGPWTALAMDFTQTNGIILPQTIVATAPSGSISDNPPTYQWNADLWAEWYHLVITRGSTTIDDKWYSKADAGCPDGTGTCSIDTGTIQLGGDHTFWIQGWNSLGYGPWNLPSGLAFNQTNGITLPQTIVATAPSGDTADNTPTYTWNADTWADWYNIIVVDPSATHVLNEWYSKADAGCPSGTGTCSVTPSTVLARGNHTLWIVGWNSLGYGPWNTLAFNITVGPPITPITTISPTGDTANRTPTFTWNASNEATQYRLYVNDPSAVVLVDQTLTAAAVGCGAGTGTCSYTPAGPILSEEGTYNWWVQVINTYGNGPWSTTTTFDFKPPVPAASTLVSPTGAITGNLPTYTWNASANATWYYLLVRDGNGTDIVTEWYSATAAGCPYGTGTCSATPATALTLPQPDTYDWWIRTYSGSGYGPWSTPLSLSVNGFYSRFNSAATGWVAHTGTWSFDSEYLFTNPSTTDLSTASNTTGYNNFDYSARIWRTGCDSCANMIIVRGDPTNAGTNPSNYWTSGYRFNFTRNGLYSVYRWDSAVLEILQSWTSTSAINQGDAWNTVRVVADGNNLYFYINGTLVWSGADATYSSGRAGIGMYRDSVPPSNTGELWVDWAYLITHDDTPAPFGEISAEQRALNEAANHTEGTFNPDMAPSTGTSSQNESNSGPVASPSENGVMDLPRE